MFSLQKQDWIFLNPEFKIQENENERTLEFQSNVTFLSLLNAVEGIWCVGLYFASITYNNA